MSIEDTPEVIPATQEEETVTPKCQTTSVSAPPTLNSGPCHRATQLGSLQSHMLAEEMAAQAQYEDKPKEEAKTAEEMYRERLEEAHTDQPSAGHSLVAILMQMLRKRRQPGLLHLVEEDNQSLLLTEIAQRCAVLEMMSKLIWTELRLMPLQSPTARRENWSFLIGKDVWVHSSTHHKKRSSSRSYRRGQH